jgi:hypothetical protein
MGSMLFSFLLMGQERNTPFQTTRNFLSYRIGTGYPFFSNGSNPGQLGQSYVYDYLDKGINYSFHAGIGAGHSFGPHFSISLSPFLIFSRYTRTEYHYENREGFGNQLRRERTGYFRYSNVSVLFPLEFNVRLNPKVDFSVGVFVYNPITDRLFDRSVETDYRLHPPKTYSPHTRFYKNRRSDPRGGIHAQCSFLLKARDWRQQRINIEYYHSLTKADYNAWEKWVMVAFKKVFFQ